MEPLAGILILMSISFIAFAIFKACTTESTKSTYILTDRVCEEEKISRLTKRVADLESPYKYDIGDKVKGVDAGFCREIGVYNGIIVDRKNNHYLGVRHNHYLIYDKKRACPEWIHEAHCTKQ